MELSFLRAPLEFQPSLVALTCSSRSSASFARKPLRCSLLAHIPRFIPRARSYPGFDWAEYTSKWTPESSNYLDSMTRFFGGALVLAGAMQFYAKDAMDAKTFFGIILAAQALFAAIQARQPPCLFSLLSASISPPLFYSSPLLWLSYASSATTRVCARAGLHRRAQRGRQGGSLRVRRHERRHRRRSRARHVGQQQPLAGNATEGFLVTTCFLVHLSCFRRFSDAMGRGGARETRRILARALLARVPVRVTTECQQSASGESQSRRAPELLL